MITGCFSAFESSSPTPRAMMSVPPPAPKGTTSVIGRLGYAWANAVPAQNAASAAIDRNVRIMVSSLGASVKLERRACDVTHAAVPLNRIVAKVHVVDGQELAGRRLDDARI